MPQNISRILIVDDDETDQFLCAHLVKNAYPEVDLVQAYDGAEALEILGREGNAPDIIFLDINMPGMGAYEFLDLYIERQHGENMPKIVMLTSSFGSRDKEKAQSYECVKSFVSKPLTKETIKQIFEL